MSKKTLALVITLFVITLVLLGVAVKNSQKMQPLSSEYHPSPITAAHTRLSLSPNPVNLVNGLTGTIQVNIDTGTNKATAVQLELMYNPSAITDVQITNGTFFLNPLTLMKNTDMKLGRITFALGITPQQQPVGGSGTVATITFTKKLGSTLPYSEVRLLSTSIVTASGISTSVLQSATGTKINLSGTTDMGHSDNSDEETSPTVQPTSTSHAEISTKVTPRITSQTSGETQR